MSETVVVEAEVVQERPWLWKKGQSGNPKGRPPKGSAFAEILEAKLGEVHPFEAERAQREGRTPRTTLECIADKLIMKAMAGHDRALEALLNRLLGKPVAKHEVKGEVDHNHEHGPNRPMQNLMAEIQLIRDQKKQLKDGE